MISTQQIEKVVVTGATGYIASAIIQQLLLKGTYKVVAIVRDKSNKDKLRHLTELKGANEHLSFEDGDLETADYATIFQGADHVLHVASPFLYTAPDPQKTIVDAAINGNLRVLEAADKVPSIKKVIITSSVVAVVDLAKKKAVYTEDDWNESTNISNPYPYSKYLAEKAAVEFRPSHFQMIIVSPSFVLGAGLASHLNSSVELFANALRGDIGNGYMGVVDLRDVVDTHMVVLTSTENHNRQRKLVSNRVMSVVDLAERAKQLFPQYDFHDHTTEHKPITPNSALFNYEVKSITPISIGRLYIDLDVTLKETVEYLISTGHLKPRLL
ncbi:hypothetical protein SAMD00019534_073110 [Acytostelium subglobosum LB1]|uniref:hypothetical protein n=1 Tax=Acytostelium subglobosum LB1 TaxID=1410327 RepID=UPI000644C604|nr:hypothetical protein SAMD00019534_073110 [Acytostelium subglobosum LB1]GAM24136.1 hypothetical protein SAMD00019534_073110 [Acytostelium subglobosum LB1]|eukprot:XP_012753172.1 hypothetical protein SAMD00019534_073110 [Acytostelium subglobosum LB1]